MSERKAQTLDLPGATLTYDVREAESESTKPILLMIGSPMGASRFATLAGRAGMAAEGESPGSLMGQRAMGAGAGTKSARMTRAIGTPMSRPRESRTRWRS
jgi:hypothetical protein